MSVEASPKPPKNTQNNAMEQDTFSVLYLLQKPDSGFESRKRLQKLICIAKYDEGIDFTPSFEFVDYHYGPYSFDLKKLRNRLESDDIIKEKNVHYSSGIEGYRYLSTNFAERLVENKKNDNREVVEGVDQLWDKYKNYTTSALVNKAKELRKEEDSDSNIQERQV
jgi:uncharacterized protein YwgA